MSGSLWPGVRFCVQHDLKVRVEIFIFLIGFHISSGCLQACYVAKDKALVSSLPLPSSPKCWDYRSQHPPKSGLLGEFTVCLSICPLNYHFETSIHSDFSHHQVTSQVYTPAENSLFWSLLLWKIRSCCICCDL